MKAWKAVLIAVAGVAIFSFIGAQAVVAGLAAAAVIAFGPKRLRSLPRAVREDAAVHMLGIIAAALISFGMSCASKFITGVELAAFMSLAAWLIIGSAVLMGAFHFACYPVKPVMSRPPAIRQERDYRRSLPRAS